MSEIETHIEKRLRFGKVYLSFLSVFSFNIGATQLTRKNILEILNKHHIDSFWEGKLKDDYEIAEKFLLPKNFHSEFLRVSLGEFKIIGYPFIKLSNTEYLPVQVIFTIYPKLKIASLLCSINILDSNVDDIIFLSQTFSGGRHLFQAILPDYICLDSQLICSHDIIAAYVKLLRDSFSASFVNAPFFFSKCIEIGEIANPKIERPGKILNNFPQQLYGLMTSDEGWRFVPKEVATEKLKNKWRTRNFLYVLIFHRCVLFLNLHKSRCHIDYVNKQKETMLKYGQLLDKYFTFSPEIGGLNHGPLLLMEFTSIQHSYLDILSERLSLYQKKTIRQCLKCREELLDAIRKLSWIKMREISILGQLIEKSMLVTDRMESLKNILEELERALLIKYNQRTNLLIIILTLTSVLIAMCSFYCTNWSFIYGFFFK